MTSTAKLSSKSQLTIPVWVRRQLGLEPGARVSLSVVDGRLVLAPLETDLDAVEGSLAGIYGDADRYIDELREDRLP
ncbi:MAG: AbrB/MazE/SpoVT family DNA-binding domain-containing protein [Deltaproteobacteria bacterium]|nr:AbrB/MazE/SpoVT family DNA-binding domain-containing protein [Deltaproteobacteria bacterium]